MANEYYDHTTFPATGSSGSSTLMRAELDAIETGFDKLPTLTANANKVIKVNAAAGAMIVSTITDDGTHVSLTGNLTTGGDITVTGGNLGVDADSLHTLPNVAADTFTLNGATQTLTNKTLALGSNTISGTLAQFQTACTDADFVTQGARDIYIPAVSMRKDTALVVPDYFTDTYAGVRVHSFSATTDTHAYASVVLPKSWNAGAIVVSIYFAAGVSDSTAVVWAGSAVCESAGHDRDSFGTEVTVTSNSTTFSSIMLVATLPPMTARDAAKSGIVFLKIGRLGTNAADTAGGIAELFGVLVTYTDNAATDA